MTAQGCVRGMRHHRLRPHDFLCSSTSRCCAGSARRARSFRELPLFFCVLSRAGTRQLSLPAVHTTSSRDRGGLRWHATRAGYIVPQLDTAQGPQDEDAAARCGRTAGEREGLGRCRRAAGNVDGGIELPDWAERGVYLCLMLLSWSWPRWRLVNVRRADEPRGLVAASP